MRYLSWHITCYIEFFTYIGFFVDLTRYITCYIAQTQIRPQQIRLALQPLSGWHHSSYRLGLVLLVRVGTGPATQRPGPSPRESAPGSPLAVAAERELGAGAQLELQWHTKSQIISFWNVQKTVYSERNLFNMLINMLYNI